MLSLIKRAGVGAGAGGAHDFEDGIHHLLANGQGADEALGGHQVSRGHGWLWWCFFIACGGEEHAALGLERGIGDIDLHDETVELGFGQGISAFLLDGVLRGEHVEGLGQVMAMASNGDVVFLHGLQQGGLGAWRRAVDFVGHQQLAEHGARHKAEGLAALLVFVEHFGAQNVSWHQVGRELHALFAEAQHGAQGGGKTRLGKARCAHQQGVAASQNGHHAEVNHLFLAEDNVLEALTGGHQFGGDVFQFLDRC